MNYAGLLKEQFNNRLELREKRPGIFQLLVPLYHEDGDMVDIFLEEAENSPGKVKVCDHAMTLMRLSYSYDLDTPNKERIFQRILSENQVEEDNGNLFLEVEPERLYPAVLHFAQTVTKVANMQLYKREITQSQFYALLTNFIEDNLRDFSPRPKVFPLPDRDDLEVDFQLGPPTRPIYLFGVKDNPKARLVTISCQAFLLQHLRFTSFVVHEDFEGLGAKDRKRLTSAVGKQFTSLEDFKENGKTFLALEI